MRKLRIFHVQHQDCQAGPPFKVLSEAPWGKTIREYCAGKMIQTTNLQRGVYLIEVQFECTVTGIGWSLVGHMQGIEQIAIASLQVPDLPPFELPTYIAEQEAQSLIDTVAPVLHSPECMITIPLKPLQLQDKALKTVKGIGTYLGWLTFVMVILAVAITAYYEYKRYTGNCPILQNQDQNAGGNDCMRGFSALCTNENNMELENKNEIENGKYNVMDGSRPSPFHHQEEKATCKNLSTIIVKAKETKGTQIITEKEKATGSLLCNTVAPKPCLLASHDTVTGSFNE